MSDIAPKPSPAVLDGDPVYVQIATYSEVAGPPEGKAWIVDVTAGDSGAGDLELRIGAQNSRYKSFGVGRYENVVLVGSSSYGEGVIGTNTGVTDPVVTICGWEVDV